MTSQRKLDMAGTWRLYKNERKERQILQLRLLAEQHYWKENVIGHPYFLPKIRVHVYFVRQMLNKKCH